MGFVIYSSGTLLLSSERLLKALSLVPRVSLIRRDSGHRQNTMTKTPDNKDRIKLTPVIEDEHDCKIETDGHCDHATHNQI